MLLTVRLFVFTCSILIVAPILRAQMLGQFIDASQEEHVPFTVTNYGTRHGLPQNQITDMIEKDDGELIIATANGITNFDGRFFNNFIRGKKYLSSLYSRLYYDRKSSYVYGRRLDGRLCLLYPQYKELSVSGAMNTSSNGLIGFNDRGVIWEYSFQSHKKKVLYKSGVRHPLSILRSGDYVYFSNNKHLYCYHLKKKTLRLVSNEAFLTISNNRYNGHIYGITRNQLFQITPGKCLRLPLESFESMNYFTDLEFSPKGELFVSSNTGLYYLYGSVRKHFGKSSFLPTSYLESLLYNDRENCLMVGSSNKGLFKLSFKNCISISNYTEAGAAALNSVSIAKDQSCYFSSTDNHVYHLTADGIQSILDFNPVHIASSTLIGDRLFIGTWGEGLFVYQNKTLLHTIKSPQIRGISGFAVFRDSQGMLWFGTDAGIAKGTSPEKVAPTLTKEVTGRIICFYERRNGDLCIGGTNGLFVLDQQRRLKAHYRSDKEIVCKEIRSFLEDREGKLWIATYNGGLFCLEKGRMTSINAIPNCLLSAEVFTLVKNNNGDIYMTSNIGLWMVNEQKLNDFYHRKIDYLVPFFYGNESGILNTEFNGGFQNNYQRTFDDQFYFPTIEGLLKVNPERLHFRKIHPKIQSIQVDGIPVTGCNSFARTTHSIEFRYYAPNFLSKFNVHYQFCLSRPGIRPDWDKMQKDGYVRFEYLPPGNYELKVRAIDGFNDEHPIISVFRFTVRAYWYESWWVKGSGILLLLLLIAWIAWYRIRSARDKQERENTINNTLLELKLKAINAKMNPHFIFNTLNNIQYLIILNKNQEAEHTLNQFSQLLRKFLQQSDHSFVRLSEEISLLELYIDIEQYRFEHKLDVTIAIPRSCEQRVIPTLLLQPVIENAFKHGLVHSDRKKVLSITVHEEEQFLVIRIEDNGIGRNKSEEINLSREAYVSHGWRLVEEKIQMVQEKYGIVITSSITDKPDQDTGTIVVFRISPIDEGLLNS